MVTARMSTQVKDRPILFSGPMVRAILEGRKTQTRRPVKPQPEYRENAALPGQYGTFAKGGWNIDHPTGMASFVETCPHGRPRDRLWVRETWGISGTGPYYRADTIQPETVNYAWKPSIHMPRWASRLTLEITKVRVERIRDISPDDLEKEGFEIPDGISVDQVMSTFCMSWHSIYPGSWERNDWVWVVEFRRVS